MGLTIWFCRSHQGGPCHIPYILRHRSTHDRSTNCSNLCPICQKL